MWVIRAVLVLVLLLLLVGFAFNNAGPDQSVAVKLEPLFPNYVGVPLLTVVFGAFVAGAVLSLLLFITIYIKISVESHAQRRRIKALVAAGNVMFQFIIKYDYEEDDPLNMLENWQAALEAEDE
mgnify:CR=1 FL=1